MALDEQDRAITLGQLSQRHGQPLAVPDRIFTHGRDHIAPLQSGQGGRTTRLDVRHDDTASRE